MSWQRTRHLLSGALVLAALVLGGVVGNVLLLGRVDRGDGGIGQLSARVISPVPAGTTTASTTTASRTTASTTTASTTTTTAATGPTTTAPAPAPQTVAARPRPGEEVRAGDRGARDEHEADD